MERARRTFRYEEPCRKAQPDRDTDNGPGTLGRIEAGSGAGMRTLLQPDSHS